MSEEMQVEKFSANCLRLVLRSSSDESTVRAEVNFFKNSSMPLQIVSICLVSSLLFPFDSLDGAAATLFASVIG